MHEREESILRRASAVLTSANFGRISAATATEYREVAARVDAERMAAEAGWDGPTASARTPATAAVRRAAWTRRTHLEVASPYRDLRDRKVSVEVAIARLEEWVPLAEGCRPAPPARTSQLLRGRPSAPSAKPSRSKRVRLSELSPDWLDVLWASAVSRECRHLDAVAVLLVTGCRPSEVCRGVAASRTSHGVKVAILGSKVTESAGQEWRKLSVAMDEDGPVAHLGALADGAGGDIHVRAACSPNALSKAVADVAESRLPGRWLSAYDIRHQRAADVRGASGGDVEDLAAWLAHAGVTTVRHYGRIPKSAGSGGARFLGAVTAQALRRRKPSPRPDWSLAAEP